MTGPQLDLAATPADLVAARTQMALSLGWHIVIKSPSWLCAV